MPGLDSAGAATAWAAKAAAWVAGGWVNPDCKPSKSAPCQLNRGAAPSIPKGVAAAAAAKNGLAAAAAKPG